MKYIVTLISSLFAVAAYAQEPLRDNIIFTNGNMPGSYFYTSATAQQPSAIKQEKGKLPLETFMTHTPGNALALSFVNGKGGSWQARVYKPVIRGQDRFKQYQHLSFWLRAVTTAGNPGDQFTQTQDLPVVQVIFADSSLSSSKKIENTVVQQNNWSRIIMPLDAGEINKQIIGIRFSQGNDDGRQHIVFIDDIELIGDTPPATITTAPQLQLVKGYAKHCLLQWQVVKDAAVKFTKIYRSADGKLFTPVGIQSNDYNSYTDFTGETGKTYHYKITFLNDRYEETAPSKAMNTVTSSMTDDALLTMVQEANFNYYWQGAEKYSGLAKENIPGRQNMVATGAAGFGMMALLVGVERQFITRAQAVERFTQIVDFLENTATFHGAFAHFVDGPTKKAEPFFGNRDNGGDLVETSFLLQGLLAAQMYFDKADPKEKAIRDGIQKIWERVEWDWYRRFNNSPYLYWHWSPDQEWIIDHKLIGWNETMVTYLLAIASPTHGVPASMYYTGWASQSDEAKAYRAGWGQTEKGNTYTNGHTFEGIKLDVGVSNGGPLFFTHYSFLGYDPHQLTDKYTNYFTNNKNIALINYRYSVRNPKKQLGYGPDGWGLTASDAPDHYAADEPVEWQDKGKLTPTGAISSFPYTPKESMAALKNYYNNYGQFAWGPYGFYDAFDLNKNWCSPIYMGLNQAPMVVMIENYRTGLLWKLLMKHKDVQAGLKKLKAATDQL